MMGDLAYSAFMFSVAVRIWQALPNDETRAQFQRIWWGMLSPEERARVDREVEKALAVFRSP